MANNDSYKNPPLTEAIFELFFECENWTPAVPGQFYNLISKDYPIITQSQNGLGFLVGPGGLTLQPGASQLTQYKSVDGSNIIQLSNGLLTINKLPKYTGWASYRDSILGALDKLQTIIKIKASLRMGLKTLNKIDIKTHSIDDYKKVYTISPSGPKGLDLNWGSIQIMLETSKNEGNDIAAVSIQTILKEPPFEAPTLLQLYFARVKNIEAITPKEWIEMAHVHLLDMFYLVLTDECKKMF